MDRPAGSPVEPEEKAHIGHCLLGKVTISLCHTIYTECRCAVIAYLHICKTGGRNDDTAGGTASTARHSTLVHQSREHEYSDIPTLKNAGQQ